MNDVQKIKHYAKKDGSVRIRNGVYVCSSEYLIEEQKEWDESDNSKSTNFNEHDFWIITDDGHIVPFSESDLD